MSVLVIVLLCILGWFGFGALFAPKSAAWGYQNSSYYPHNPLYAKEAAGFWYWWTIFLGPAVAIVWLTFFSGRALYRPASANGESRLEMALVKHDESYRKKYLDEQERRIAQLEQENARLTKDILR